MALKEKPPHVTRVRPGDMLVSDGSFMGIPEGARGLVKLDGTTMTWRPLPAADGSDKLATVNILTDEWGYLIGFTCTPLVDA